MRASTLLLSVCLVSTVAGAATEVPTSAEARIKAALAERYPGSPVESVHATTLIPGWYEVVTPTEIAYTDANADYLLVGKLVDTRSKEDLTEQRLGALHAIDFRSLPFELAVETVKGDGRRSVAIFEDPNCPYCRQLEHNIQDLDNVTIYTFLYPLEELHPGATAKARAIWCATDRSAAWNGWMRANVDPGGGQCSADALVTLQTLGRKLKIDGTPTMFFADGHRKEGAISREEMERRLGAAVAAAAR
jgi:thiol:disulfide interchange protein DsbC